MSVEPDFSLPPDRRQARAAAQELFVQIAPTLRNMLRSADIRHVGATAVAGCLTKGDLDLVVRIGAEDFIAADATLGAHFARNTGSVRTNTFSSFEDRSTTPHLGIQLTVVGAPYDFFHTFVEALEYEPGVLARYNTLKQQSNGQPMAAYRAAKGAFIEKVLSTSAAKRECS